MRDLGTLGGPDAFAVALNESGHVAGFSYTDYIPNQMTGFPQIDPFLWHDGKMVDLGSLGGPTGFASYLNNRSQVVGQMDLAETSLGSSVSHPFLWDRGTLKDLGSFPGAGFYGSANWINEAGEIVGWADDNIDDFPALWIDGVIRNLGTVAGDTCGYANAINSTGQIVGKSGPCLGVAAHAFLWQAGGPIVDLNTLIHSGSGVHLNSALSINERGEIAALGLLPNGDQHAFVLIPCAEGDDGCGKGWGEIAVPQISPALRTQPRTWPPSTARRMSQYRFPGPAFGPRN
jgi:probable HAF family extracellular repeat protein